MRETTESPRTLSSMQSFLMKAIFPVLWIGLFGFGTLMLWVDFVRHDEVLTSS